MDSSYVRLDGKQQNNNLSNLWNPNMCAQWMNILRKKGIFEIGERLRSNFVSKKDGSSYLILILLLSDDIELNPGPVSNCDLCKKKTKCWDKAINGRRIIMQRLFEAFRKSTPVGSKADKDSVKSKCRHNLPKKWNQKIDWFQICGNVL